MRFYWCAWRPYATSEAIAEGEHVFGALKACQAETNAGGADPELLPKVKPRCFVS